MPQTSDEFVICRQEALAELGSHNSDVYPNIKCLTNKANGAEYLGIDGGKVRLKYTSLRHHQKDHQILSKLGTKCPSQHDELNL